MDDLYIRLIHVLSIDLLPSYCLYVFAYSLDHATVFETALTQHECETTIHEEADTVGGWNIRERSYFSSPPLVQSLTAALSSAFDSGVQSLPLFSAEFLLFSAEFLVCLSATSRPVVWLELG